MDRDERTTAQADATHPAGESGAAGGAVRWTFDPAQGAIQGPLDLGFFAGQALTLDLREMQAALLIEHGQCRRTFGPGEHVLEIPPESGQPAEGRCLAFLDLDGAFTHSWTRMNPIVWGPDRSHALIGNCTLRIADPETFFATFMAGANDWEPVFLQRLLEQSVRGALEALLSAGEFEPQGMSFPELQARITRLSPADLDEMLAPDGLECSELAVYTAAPPLEHQDSPRPRPEIAGQFPGLAHN